MAPRSNFTQFSLSLKRNGEVYSFRATDPPLSAPTSNGSEIEYFASTTLSIVPCPTCAPSTYNVIFPVLPSCLWYTHLISCLPAASGWLARIV